MIRGVKTINFIFIFLLSTIFNVFAFYGFKAGMDHETWFPVHCRVEVVLAPSLSGPQAMVVVMVTTATAMVILTASTPYPSQAAQRMEMFPGILKPAHPHLQPHTAVVLVGKNKL